MQRFAHTCASGPGGLAVTVRRRLAVAEPTQPFVPRASSACAVSGCRYVGDAWGLKKVASATTYIRFVHPGMQGTPPLHPVMWNTSTTAAIHRR